jgi:hypothetical protein
MGSVVNFGGHLSDIRSITDNFQPCQRCSGFGFSAKEAS